MWKFCRMPSTHGLVIAALLAATTWLSGCHAAAESGCTTNSECRVGRWCVSGACVSGDARDVTLQAHDSAPYGATTFILHNSSGRTVFYQSVSYQASLDACPAATPWWSVGDGQTTFGLKPVCGPCDGSVPVSTCEPRGCVNGCEVLSAKKLAPGDALRASWDGTYWMVRHNDTREGCNQHIQTQRSPVYVTFCWGLRVGPQGVKLLDPVCKKVPFKPSQHVVTYDIPPVAANE